jgi:uncharacterized RDD family membrane protein YckC
MQTNFSTEHKDLLTDLDEMQTLIPATKGQRFANLLVDGVIAIIIALMLFAVMAVMGFDLESTEGDLTSRVLSYIVFAIYYTLFEGLNNGRTIGKMVTGTQAVRFDGEKLSMEKALLRSLSRCVPFEQFSGFGEVPWHDKWTDTTVVKYVKK